VRRRRHDILASEERNRLRVRRDERAAAVYVNVSVGVHPVSQDGFDYLFSDIIPELLGCDVRVVLGGDDNGVNALGLAEFVFDGDLGLAVGAQVREDTFFPHLRQAQAEMMRQSDGERHELRGLVRGVAEHHALVPGARPRRRRRRSRRTVP
jgi:hypothetical protein